MSKRSQICAAALIVIFGVNAQVFIKHNEQTDVTSHATEVAPLVRKASPDNRIATIQSHLQEGKPLSRKEFQILKGTKPAPEDVLLQSKALAILQLANNLAQFSQDQKGRVMTASLHALRSQDPLARRGAAATLGWVGDKSTVPALASHLKDPDQNVQRAAKRALARVQARSRTGLA